MKKVILPLALVAGLWIFAGLNPPALIMLALSLVLMGLGIFKEYEPLLLIPIGFGAFVANIPSGGMDSYAYEALLIQKSGLVADEDGHLSPVQITLKHDNHLFLNDGALQSRKLKKDETSIAKIKLLKEGCFLQALSEDEHIKVNAQPVKEKGITLDDGDMVTIGDSSYVVKISRGLLSLLYLYLLKSGIIPPLIFMGVGAMTDFGPLLRNVGLAIYGAAAQLGIFTVFILSLFFGFTREQAAALGIIGGADGPTAVYLAIQLAPELLGAIAVAAYSYMALVPIIIPFVVRLLTTKDELKIHMKNLEKADGKKTIKVSKRAKIIFPVMVVFVCGIFVPSSVVLVGMLMFGNLVKEVGIPSVVERLAGVSKGALINMLTIFLGLTVGGTMKAEYFLEVKTLLIIAGGFFAFAISIAGGIMAVKFYNIWAKKMGWKPTNPLIGATGLSAVPMASRVANELALKEDPTNHILHYCMASNIAGVIGSAVAAGFFLSQLG